MLYCSLKVFLVWKQAKTCLPRWMLSSRSRRYRDVQFCRYSLNGRCRRSSCILTVLTTYLVSSLATSSSQNVWNVPGMFRYFVLLYQNNATSSQGLLGCRPFPSHLCCTVDVVFHISQTSPKFQISWSTVVYEELAVGFEPIRNGEWIFWMDNGLYFTSHATDSHEL